jgi:hypothetical protein
MPGNLTADKISPADFDAALARYEKHVPDKLSELDQLRFVSIPSSLKSRNEGPGPWVEKEELQQLVDWKLYSLN